MSQWLQENNEYLIAFVSILLTVITGLATLIAKFLFDELKEVKGLKDAILRNTRRINETHQKINDSISDIQTTQYSQGSALNKLQGTLDRGIVGQEQQKEKTDKVLQDTKWTRNKLESLIEFYGKLVKAVAQNGEQITKIKSDIIRLGNDRIMIKDKKEKK